MKIMRIFLLILFIFLCHTTAYAATYENAHGEMGDAYRTVALNVMAPLSWRPYYLALPQGSEPPTTEKIIAYIKGEALDGLTDGSVVRGRLRASDSGRYTLHGMEGLNPLPGEQGFVAGRRYDIYLISDHMAADAVALDVMAQPFERVGQNGEFYINTAGQLANIQRLASLYIDSQGSQGSTDFLISSNKRYVLSSDIDLPPGWTPIGDVEANPAFVFKGSFNGQGYTIKGLEAEKNPRAVQGLFGKLEGANISNLTLANANLRLDGEYNGRNLAAGLLAGEAVGGTIKNISIENGTISATLTGSKDGAIGGLLGKGTDMRLANIRVDVRLDIGGTSNHDNKPTSMRDSSAQTEDYNCAHMFHAVGGLAGYLSACTVERSYVKAQISANAAATGGVVGLASDAKFYYSGADGGRITGKNATGGFAGRLENTGLVLECHSHADVEGETAGGMVGQISGSKLSANVNHAQQIFQSKATGLTVSPNGIAGGFVGEGNYTLVKDSSAYGDVRGPAGAGGFVGRLSNCSRVIYSYAKGDVFLSGLTGFAGGFVGELTNAACVEFAYATGSAIVEAAAPIQAGDVAVGGFVGVISAHGVPNTLTRCLSFAPWVVGPKDGHIHRFAGRMDHDGVNGCYAYLGSMVVHNGSLAHVLPSAYGPDGADMSSAQVEDITKRLGWRRPAPR